MSDHTLQISEEAMLTEAMAQELRTVLSLDEMMALEERLDELVLSAERTAAKIVEKAGPNPGPVAARMLNLVRMGCGYHRTVRDGIRSTVKDRNARARRLTAKQQSGEGEGAR